MMKLPLICVAALLAAAVSVPAQVSVQGNLGRLLGRNDRSRPEVVQRAPVQHQNRGGHSDPNHGNRARGGHNHGGHNGHHHHVPVQKGHWQTVSEQFLVPGYWHDEHVPATYGWVYDNCGHRHWGVVNAAGCRRVWVPARWETRSRRVWVAC
jgi:hypothetical protein